MGFLRFYCYAWQALDLACVTLQNTLFIPAYTIDLSWTPPGVVVSTHSSRSDLLVYCRIDVIDISETLDESMQNDDYKY